MIAERACRKEAQMTMTFAELLARVPDKVALEERAAIIQFESGEIMTREAAEKEAVKQWLEGKPQPKKQQKMFQ